MRDIVFCTLNWNTTALLQQMHASVEDTTPEPHRWVVLDNGSDPGRWQALRLWAQRAGLHNGAQGDLIRFEENQGCFVGYNRAFDVAGLCGRPHDVVMINTDITVHDTGWLSRVRAWADSRPEVGMIGFEHSRGEVCAAAIFLDPNGNWYTQGGQTSIAEPCEGESVGLGFALLRWPVLEAGLRFDTGYKFYYKGDDDFAFQVRASLGLSVWAYPIDCIHHGRGSLKANNWQVGPAKDKASFEAMKRANQERFAKAWEWALRDRRPSLEAEREHLEDMKQVMAKRRGEG